jgi:acyl-coenzyme A synthetase/AMP-(fatty) acid ligase
MLYLAISRAGAYTSPIPMQWRRREYEHVLELTEASTVITIDSFNGFEHVDLCEQL